MASKRRWRDQDELWAAAVERAAAVLRELRVQGRPPIERLPSLERTLRRDLATLRLAHDNVVIALTAMLRHARGDTGLGSWTRANAPRMADEMARWNLPELLPEPKTLLQRSLYANRALSARKDLDEKQVRRALACIALVHGHRPTIATWRTMTAAQVIERVVTSIRNERTHIADKRMRAMATKR